MTQASLVSPHARATAARLDGWKQIADFFGRTVRTVQRWERDEALPVHRHLQAGLAVVYAHPIELDAWVASRSPRPIDARGDDVAADPAMLVAMSHRYWAQRSLDGFRKAIALCETALAHHASYAPAHAALARVYATRASYAYFHPADDVAVARAHGSRALALDPHLADAHQALGFILSHFDWDWARADAAFDAALGLDRDSALTHQWCSILQLALSRDDQACAMSARAEALEPASLVTAANTVWLLYLTGRLEESIARAAMLVERNPHFWRGYFQLGLSLAATGRLAEAHDAIELAAALNDHMLPVLIAAHVAGRRGWRQAAREVARRSKGRFISPYWQAFAHVGCGDLDAAITSLQRAVDAREWFVLLLDHEPAFEPLRSMAAFRALVARVGLP